MRPQFEKTVDILVKAYLNDTLQHGNDCACAVGNLIAHANGWVYDQNHNCKELLGYNWYDYICGHKKFGVGLNQINSTGYTVKEIMAIEKAFESVRYDAKAVKMFNGLMAVVDVLAEIHGISLEQKQEAKALFVKV